MRKLIKALFSLRSRGWVSMPASDWRRFIDWMQGKDRNDETKKV